MLKTYFKIAFRNLWRHKGFSFINIMGLAVGMAACFLIYLYVHFELSYDAFHQKSDRIYRLVTDVKTPSETLHAGITNWPFAPNIKTDFPEVESFLRVQQTGMLVRKGEKKFQEDHMLWADSSFFTIFDFKLLEGDRKTLLKDPFNVVLSRTAARKYFGDEDPLGQTLLLDDDGRAAKVSGLMEDLPENSQVKADILISMTTLTQQYAPGRDEQWGNFGATTYLLLRPGTDPKSLEKKLPAFLERKTGKEMRQSQMSFTLFLEPLKDVYLKSTREGLERGNINNVYTLSIIAIFILLIACINFVNLTTARSAERAKEVGIRKVVGAERRQLTSQFIGESLIISLIAFLLALVLAALFLPLFNQLAGKTISAGLFSNADNIILLGLTAVGIGVLAGVYPALVLSSFRPVVVLKGRFSSGNKGILLRKGLVIAQFTISIGLIIGTIVVYNQMNYMRNQDLGFSKDQTLIIDTHGDPAKDALKEQVSNLPGVKSACLSSSVPGSSNPAAYSEIENIRGDMQIANIDLYFVDFDYIPHYQMKVLAGRPFLKSFPTDTTQAIVLNESAIKLLGYSTPQQAIGRKFRQWGREGKIIGVVKDFHFRSLQEEIKPLSMRIEPGGTSLLSVRLSGAKIPETVAAIEKKWKSLIIKRPFSYDFLNTLFDEQYKGEERFGRLILNFSILAIFISCLGLLGLASYSTIQRTKEIGIRKVIGASTSNIVQLLSTNFLFLVCISFAIAVPLAWWFMHRWLQDFAYRISISWWVFILAGITALLIALVTVSFQAIKAAIANPVNNLRAE